MLTITTKAAEKTKSYKMSTSPKKRIDSAKLQKRKKDLRRLRMPRREIRRSKKSKNRRK